MASKVYRPTGLQELITKNTEPHFKRQPEECKLIQMMMSFYGDQRPSCDRIIESVTEFESRVCNRTADSGERTEESAWIPTVFNLG